MKKLFTLLLVLLCAGSINAQEVLMNVDFDNTNEMTEYLIKAFQDKGSEVAEGYGYNGSKGMRLTFKGQSDGSNHFVRTPNFGTPCDEVTLNYRVMFEEDYQFVKGGKLHGLGPAKNISGGLEMRPDGWSARVAFGSKNTIKPYIYHQTKTIKWGTGAKTETHYIELGKYHDVALYVKLNYPADAHNGIMEIWLDGKMLSRLDNIQYRSVCNDSSLIQTFLFSTFYGGHTEDCAPKNPDGSFATCHSRFDDFTIYKGYYIRK